MVVIIEMSKISKFEAGCPKQTQTIVKMDFFRFRLNTSIIYLTKLICLLYLFLSNTCLLFEQLDMPQNLTKEHTFYFIILPRVTCMISRYLIDVAPLVVATTLVGRRSHLKIKFHIIFFYSHYIRCMA
jgi:hypothetical protein